MKKLSTNLSKCHFTMVMAAAMIVCAFSASAEEYRSFIRQDRVWLCTSWERGEHTAKYMKFTDSKDFMGKTYTRVSTIKKVTWDYGMTDIRIEEDINETEAWMREDVGKVYLLLDGWEPDPYMYPVSSTEPVEGLLYDFTAEMGSPFEGIAQYRSYENHTGLYWEGWYHVLAVGTETVGEEDVRSWDVKFSLTKDGERSTQTYRMVEGIGIVDYEGVYGGLYYVETFEHTSGMNGYNGFDCCMDLDGNILYPKDFKDELPGGGLPSGIEEIRTADQSEADAPLYDMMGRRITKPTPGQLYIQGGKKHIAK